MNNEKEIKSNFLKLLDQYIIKYKNFYFAEDIDNIFGKENDLNILIKQAITLLEYSVEFLKDYDLLYEYKVRFFFILKDTKKIVIPGKNFSLQDEADFVCPPQIELCGYKSNHMINTLEMYRKPLNNVIDLPESLKKNCRVYYEASGMINHQTGKLRHYMRYITCEYYPDEYVGRYLDE